MVAEVSIGLRGGVGRLVIEYAQAAGGDQPDGDGAGFVALLGLALRPYRRSEVAA